MINIIDGKLYEFSWNKWIEVDTSQLEIVALWKLAIITSNGLNPWYCRYNFWVIHLFGYFRELEYIKEEMIKVLGEERVNLP